MPPTAGTLLAAALPALAQRIAGTAAGIRPGDVVMVFGGKHTIPRMEAVAIEAQKAGGMERVAKAAEASQILNQATNESGVQAVFVGYPSRQLAAVNRLSYDRLERMHWAVLGAD